MTQKDAAMFPIIASAALFGLYIFFQVSAEIQNAEIQTEIVTLQFSTFFPTIFQCFFFSFPP